MQVSPIFESMQKTMRRCLNGPVGFAFAAALIVVITYQLASKPATAQGITYALSGKAAKSTTATPAATLRSQFSVPATSSYTYTNGLGFGTDANGNVWNIWSANGSNIWDWRQNYVGKYLHYAFKIHNYSGFYCSGSCRYHNVWDKNPNLGFEISNVLGHDSGIFPESAQNNHKYQVDIQWNANGYHASVYDITAGSQYSDRDYTYSVNANTYDSWTWGYSLWTDGIAYKDEDASAHASQWTSTVFQGEATGTTGGGGDVRTDALPVVLPTVTSQCNTGSFAAKTDFGTGGSPRNLALGDFNRDGKLDLAVTNEGSDTVSILLGIGTATLGTKTDFGTGNAPTSVAAGDFNGDGKPDLAVTNTVGTVSILLGTGTGSFGPKTDFGTGALPSSVSVRDFNGDGKLDLAVPNRGSNSVSILLGTGTGSFGSKTDFGTATNPFSVAVGDFNGDSKLDLAVPNYNSNTVSILLGTGTGTFGAKTDFGTGSLPTSVTVGDFNGDAKLDLAVTNANSIPSTVSILLSTGAGSFGAKTDFATGGIPTLVAVGDFNGDSKLDLATANFGSNTVSILLGTGTGSFGAKADFGTGNGPVAVAVGDFNGDGKLDLAAANSSSNTVSVLLNTCGNTSSVCTLACNAIVPATATINAQVPFIATTTLANCTGTPSYEWNFGDGTPNSTLPNPKHTYAQAKSYNWTLTVRTTGAGTCTKTGTIAVTTSCTAPVIEKQPETLFINTGGQATLTVTANGSAPFTYQWFDALTSAAITGATSNRYVTPPLTVHRVYFVRVSNACGTQDSHLGSAVLTQIPTQSIDVFDPLCNASHVCQGAFLETTATNVVWLTSNVTTLAKASERRSGAAADGVTLLLLRVSTTTPVTFKLAGSPPANGTLLPRQGGQGSGQVIANAENGYAFAVYQAPLNLPASNAEARITASSATASWETSIRLHSPPVVLVHGVWSKPDTWTRYDSDYYLASLLLIKSVGYSLQNYLEEKGYIVTLADYSDDNAGSFRPDVASIPVTNTAAAIDEGLRQMRARGFAATQVDMVGHSMGGLVARSIAARTKNYIKNYQRGSLHKLITIGTPHQGSELADWLIANRAIKLKKVANAASIAASITKGTNAGVVFKGISFVADAIPLEAYFLALNKPFGPALIGFQTTTCDRYALGDTVVPSHAIVGMAPNQSETERIYDGILFSTDKPDRIHTILGANHDTLVKTGSQQGGLSTNNFSLVNGIVHAPLLPSILSDDRGETTDNEVWKKVYELLGKRADDQTVFAKAFDRSTSPGTCPANFIEPPALVAEVESAPTLLTPDTASAATVNFVVSPATTVRPGELVTINFAIEGGNQIAGAMIRANGRIERLDGNGPFSLSFPAPLDQGGRLEIIAETFGGDPENYVAGTFLNIAPAAALTALEATTKNVLLRSVGETAVLDVLGVYADGTRLRLNGARGNSTYAIKSGKANVITVNADGIVTAQGIGQDEVIVTNAGKTTNVRVYVSTTGVIPNTVTATVSAASYSNIGVAVESIVSMFGVNLATTTQAARVNPLPTTLAGTSVMVRDSLGTERLAPLFFVSSGQINYQIPLGTAPGVATITVNRGDLPPTFETLLIEAVTPGLFTFNANGKDVAAASALRVKANNAQSYESIARFDQTLNKFVPIPIDLSVATDQVFLILYGTGLRYHSGLANVVATMGGTNAQVLYAGAQGSLVGLDQINVLIPRSLIGRGEIDVVLTVNGKVTNTVRVSIK